VVSPVSTVSTSMRQCLPATQSAGFPQCGRIIAPHGLTPLASKTDRVGAWVLAELARVPLSVGLVRCLVSFPR
jgi:hypothetical protein